MTATRKKSSPRCQILNVGICLYAGSLLATRFFHQLCRLKLLYADGGKESNGLFLAGDWVTMNGLSLIS
jgi:hypothetical protein